MNDQESSAATEPILLAEERTRLAKDRTFAAIIRTVLALIAFGVTVARVLPDIHPGWMMDVLGALLILSGGLIAALGFRSTHATITKLRAHGIDEPHWLVVATRLLLAAIAILSLVIVAMY